MSLVERTRALLRTAIEVYRGSPHEARLVGIESRFDEPLRVALAGRVKAGKSTLLNALIGERLAATDRRECTRIVTWYEDGHTYRVVAHPKEGDPSPLRFTRNGAALRIDLGGLRADEVEQIMVTWPSQTLRTATLIDTPGIGSLSERVSRRAWELVAPDDTETPADAVLYLMRHLHVHDVEFLSAFHDTEVAQPNPVNAVGVLSRADEIAVGRGDTMTSALRVADQFAAEPTVRRVVQTVVPVAGLLAETAVTLTEVEVARLRKVAALPATVAESLLLSADRFRTKAPELGLSTDQREDLLARFGLFGVRLASALLRDGTAATAPGLALALAERSGIRALQGVVGALFFERRDVLKSRSALLAVQALTRTAPAPGSAAVEAQAERILAGAHPFQELRVLSSLRAGGVPGRPEVLAELERVIGGAGGAPAVRLGLDPAAGPAEIAAAAGTALTRWQRRAENPLTGREMVVAARVAVRSCEGMLADLRRHRST